MSPVRPLAEWSNEELIEHLGEILPFEGPESVHIRALLQMRGAQDQAHAVQQLVVSTDRLVDSSNRLSWAT
jgi:hypothetical protein